MDFYLVNTGIFLRNRKEDRIFRVYLKKLFSKILKNKQTYI